MTVWCSTWCSLGTTRPPSFHRSLTSEPKAASGPIDRAWASVLGGHQQIYTDFLQVLGIRVRYLLTKCSFIEYPLWICSPFCLRVICQVWDIFNLYFFESSCSPTLIFLVFCTQTRHRSLGTELQAPAAVCINVQATISLLFLLENGCGSILKFTDGSTELSILLLSSCIRFLKIFF